MSAQASRLQEAQPAVDSAPIVVGVLAAHGTTRDLAAQLAAELPRELGERFGHVQWRTQVSEVPAAEPSANSGELVETVRRHLLDEGWDLAVGLTDLPLRAGARPVTAQASATHGVGLVSVPALGAMHVAQRLRRAVVHLIEGLLGESAIGAGGNARAREARLAHRLHELASPLGRARVRDDGSVRFVSAALRGNLRLLVGMVRANQPSRIIARLSRALVAALGTAAVSLASANIWHLSDGMTWPRLTALALGSLLGTCLTLVLAHQLWERAASPAARERVVLFNLVTAITLALGVLTLYFALFLITLVCGGALIPPSHFAHEVGRSVGLTDYVRLAWLVASLATVGGALGSLIESDLAVRDAAYRRG